MIRRFKPTPMPPEAIERIIAYAQQYPSAGYSQGVAFIVVTDPGVRRRLRTLHAYDAPLMIVPCVSEQLYHDRYRAPDKLRPDGTEIEWPVPFWNFDVGCSCMLIFLAAVNEGLAAAFAGAFRPDSLRAELGIPSHFLPIGIVSIGYPDLEQETPSPSLKRGRRPRAEVIRAQHW
jgi:nitroreductase